MSGAEQGAPPAQPAPPARGPVVPVDATAYLAGLVGQLSDQYMQAIRNALASVHGVSRQLNCPDEISQEAIDIALLITAVGTFEERLRRKTGKAGTAAEATREMLRLIPKAARKPVKLS